MAKIDSLFPILEFESGGFKPDTKPLSGLARTAAEAPLDSTGCLTEYRPLQSRSILSKVNSKRGAPFTHAINPYRGCEFGCRYCYARYTHEFLEMRDPEEFERRIFFKQNAAWLLTQELKRLKPGTHIAIGTATDPYQPLERRQMLTRSILEVLAQTSRFTLGIVTKSTLVERDIDLLQRIRERNRLTVHLTVTTMNTKLARILEPRAPRPDLRIETVRTLRQAGLRAGVLCSPLMPGITDSRSSMAAVAKAAAAAGACFLASGALFLKPCSLPTFFAFVKSHFPELLKAYEKRYENNAFVSPEYRKRVAELLDSVCREFKLGRRYSEIPQEDEIGAPALETQPWLPFERMEEPAEPRRQMERPETTAKSELV
ncbi:MAG TPA: radical SAM protein [Terracidiphilus sp.]|jgi:DNA repair photolyase|nr:radical SAM protein [Terracidiphilus sp.]